MEQRYQRARHDGHLDWSVGASSFTREWEPVRDLLRFHRGEGFRIVERPNGTPGPVRRLGELDQFIHTALDKSDAGTVFDIESEKDKDFGISMRRIQIYEGGDRIVSHAQSRKGIPYVFGVTDCSWLSEASYAPEIDEDWVHNAHAQHLMFQNREGYSIIGRNQIKTGDVLWHHNDDHVSIYIDGSNGGRVWDTEPHSVQGPTGWGWIPAGVQIRPMIGNYYCNWDDVNGIGRVHAVNGKP